MTGSAWVPGFDFTMHLLDSRASRMSPNQAFLTRTTSEGSMPITASSTLLPSYVSIMLSRILKPQVFSPSALSVAVAATIPRNP